MVGEVTVTVCLPRCLGVPNLLSLSEMGRWVGRMRVVGSLVWNGGLCSEMRNGNMSAT